MLQVIQNAFPIFSKDQLIYLNPCEGMPVEKAVDISKGKRTILCEPMDAPRMPV